MRGLRPQEQVLVSLAAIHRLPNPADRLAPTKDLLIAFALALTDRGAGPARRPPVATIVFARHVAIKPAGDARPRRWPASLERSSRGGYRPTLPYNKQPAGAATLAKQASPAVRARIQQPSPAIRAN